MKNEYIVELKGIKENNYCWRYCGGFNNLKEAISHYNYFKGGCCKRIKRIRTIKKIKVMKFKKY